MNILLVAGAFTAADVGTVRAEPPAEAQRYVWSRDGRIADGDPAPRSPAAAAGSCFNPWSYSPAGWAMWIGLLAGAQSEEALLWTLETIEWGTTRLFVVVDRVEAVLSGDRPHPIVVACVAWKARPGGPR